MKRWALLPLLLAASWSSAQIAGGLPGSGAEFVLKAPITAAEAKAIFKGTASVVTRVAPKIGKVVGWGGVISLGPELINQALTSFYNLVGDEAAGSGSPELDRVFRGDVNVSPKYVLGYTDFSDSSGYRHVVAGPTGGKLFMCNTANASIYHFSDIISYAGTVVDTRDYFWTQFGEGRNGGSRTDSDSAYRVCAEARGSLASVIDAPGAAEAATKIVNDYLKANPDQLAAALTFASPTPTGNQMADDTHDPFGDIDGDGVSDRNEVAAGSDPLDPTSKPSLEPITTTTTNPDGSVTITTTTYGPDGTPHSTSTTATPGKVVTDTDNPDGSKTHTETTTNADLTRTEVSTTTSVSSVTNADGSRTEVTTTTTTTKVFDKDGKLTSTETKTETSTKQIPKEEECTDSQVLQSDGTCKDKETDPGNECNDFSVARFLKHPGTYIKELFIPCDQWANVFDELKDAVKDRFPFSMTSRLDHLVTFNGTANQADVLPSKIGPFDLDWSWIAPLLLVTSVLFKSAIGYIAINFVIGKFSGQLVMK